MGQNGFLTKTSEGDCKRDVSLTSCLSGSPWGENVVFGNYAAGDRVTWLNTEEDVGL